MNYKKVLEKLGFIEGKDFSLTETSFVMLQQPRMVQQIINHPEVAATFDTEGVELTPLIPAYDEVVMIEHPFVPAVLDVDGVTVLSPEIPAWSEPSMIEEFFTLTAPTQMQLDETWKQVQLSEADIALLVSEYLKGKELLRDADDSINIHEGNIHSWSFKNIIQPTIDELIAIIPAFTIQSTKDALIKEKADKGKKFREDCDRCLDLITGFNDGNNLSAVQIQQMLATFANINAALSNRMPKTAKALLLAVVPDGVIVTQEMKDMALEVLKDYPVA